MVTEKFHANGKLLLTSEYLILDHATGLSLPTKKGQSFSVSYNRTADSRRKTVEEGESSCKSRWEERPPREHTYQCSDTLMSRAQ